MSKIKRIFKRNTHNFLFKGIAGFGRAMNRLYENRNHDIHSNGELTVLKKIGKTNPKIIIDGGANIGQYSLFIHKFCSNSKIYAFEPVESTFKILVESTKHVNNITAKKLGLYSSEVTKEINVFNSSTHASIYDIDGLNYAPVDKTSIDLIKGDDFIKNEDIGSIDFLKIDVEGAEYETLLGFEDSINKGIIKAIQFEYGYINITTKKLLIDFIKFFQERDYCLGKIFPKTVEFREYEFKHEDFLGPNFIAVKNTETELIELLKRK